MIDIGHAHPYLVLLIAVGSIILVAIWPEIQHLFPRLPTTMHERVHLVETAVTDHATRLSGVEGRWNNSRVAEILPDHENRLLIQAGCLQKIALLALWMDDVALLIYGAEQCHVKLSEIKRRYPQSEVAARPFSKTWRQFTGQEPSDEATRLGMMWVTYLTRHIYDCLAIASPGKAIAGEATQRLAAFVNAWDSPDATADNCLTMISEHKEELKKNRDLQAANFADPTLTRVN